MLADLQDDSVALALDAQRGTVVVAFLVDALRSSREVEARLEALRGELEGRAAFVRLEATSCPPEVTSSFRIQVLPTVLVFRDGAEVGRLEGLRPAHHYAIAVESALVAPPDAHTLRVAPASP